MSITNCACKFTLLKIADFSFKILSTCSRALSVCFVVPTSCSSDPLSIKLVTM